MLTCVCGEVLNRVVAHTYRWKGTQANLKTPDNEPTHETNHIK